jgi:hypothetical protein
VSLVFMVDVKEAVATEVLTTVVRYTLPWRKRHCRNDTQLGLNRWRRKKRVRSRGWDWATFLTMTGPILSRVSPE